MKGDMVELAAFICYLVVVLAMGVYFFLKGKKTESGDKDYFLGGRNMNGLVAALSAGASDMSAWVLMGLPGSIYLYGMGQVWISVGLLIGTVCAWTFVAPRLRRYSIKANDSITIPQFLVNLFGLHVVMNELFYMILATFVILFYTFLGGFNAVCWTDFFQGMLMLLALLTAPIVALFAMRGADFTPLAPVVTGEHYYSLLSTGKWDWGSISDIVSGFGWGLGYLGMPHILVRYMSIRSEKEMKKSCIVGSTWTALILIMASAVALVGHEYLGTYLDDGSKSLIFVYMVRSLFPALLSGVLLSAILAASMSTADSQLLASSSAFASDVYKPVFRKNASNKEMLWAGRIIVAVISVVALIIALSPNCKGIMALVECAWAAFGSAFGPTIVLALYWKRFTYKGAVAGIVGGFVTDALWYAFLSESTGLYEIIPGFAVGLAAAVIVSLLDRKPSKEVEEMFEAAQEKTE